MRTRFLPALALLTLVVPPAVLAQTPRPPALPPTNQAIFAPLELPPANDVRTATGAPGPAYWQQEADYDLKATLDTAQHRVTASELITYVNNSPDSLPFLWLQLGQNLFAPGSRGALINSGDLERWRGSFPGGGVKLASVAVMRDGRRYVPDYVVDGTRMRVDLQQAMRASGDTLRLEFSWSFVIPEYGADRMGRLDTEAGWVYEIAQWYPRMHVYDDVHGWNPMPYLGQGEFYLEYGDFHAEITVPHDMIVAGSGALLNPEEVLTPGERSSLDRARSSAETVPVITPGQVGKASTRPPGTQPLTWKFEIKHSRDFSWAASRAFIWDATGWDGVLIQSMYPHEGLGTKGDPGWESATQDLRHTISYYSTEWYHFPWPAATNVAGIVGGMEYPGIVFCSVNARGEGLFSVTDHEFGHSWFPMIVGSDERRYAWMDEGFNTFINHYSNLDFIGPRAASVLRTQADYIAGRMQEPIADQPIMTYPDVLRGDGLGFLAYRKPGFGLVMLRETILGEATFKKAMRTYIAEWAFKHPKPRDFFRTMEDVSGAQLSWFWRGWFYGTQLLDQSVTSVEDTDAGTVIHLGNDAGLVMPVLLRVEMKDGRTLDRRLPVQVWIRGDSFDYLLPDKGTVERVVIDPDHALPDVNRDNNAWDRPPRG
ncbi:MAG: M1 family metallopeptidase [Gemmatimonadetes bacterium]|nr:M1 family metallopeptidase [Gemmatimonadota bacterium]